MVLVNKDAKRLALTEGSSSKLRLSGFLGSVLKASLTRICVWTLTLKVRNPHVPLVHPEPPRSTSMTTEHAIGQGAAGNHSIFQQLEDYAWASDAEFQSGLQAILGTNPAPEQAEQLTLRARCFYLSRYIARLSESKLLEH